jgi:FlaG/FlaF family flagellin (archaellin)
MAANTAPIFTETALLGRAVWLPATTANVKSDGAGTIGTDILLLVTAGADGSFLNRVRFTPSASVAATATTASIHRLYLSTASSGATTSANTTLIAEYAAPAQTTDQTTVSVQPIDVPLGFYIPTGIQLLWSMHHAAAASTAWHAVAFAGSY